MGNIFKNVIKLFSTTSDPASPSNGDLWYRSDTSRPRVRANGTTQSLAYLTDVSGILKPYYISGRYYDNRTTMAQPGTVVATAGTIFYVPIYIFDSITINQIGVYVGTGGAGSTTRLALYTHTNGVPSTLITDYGTVATTTSSAAATITISVSLTAGLYYIAVLTTATAPTLASAGVATLFAPVGTATLTGAAPTTTGWIQVTTSMPSTATPGNHAGATPMVAVRVA